jgi:hypothetical protein
VSASPEVIRREREHTDHAPDPALGELSVAVVTVVSVLDVFESVALMGA